AGAKHSFVLGKGCSLQVGSWLYAKLVGSAKEIVQIKIKGNGQLLELLHGYPSLGASDLSDHRPHSKGFFAYRTVTIGFNLIFFVFLDNCIDCLQESKVDSRKLISHCFSFVSGVFAALDFCHRGKSLKISVSMTAL